MVFPDAVESKLEWQESLPFQCIYQCRIRRFQRSCKTWLASPCPWPQISAWCQLFIPWNSLDPFLSLATPGNAFIPSQITWNLQCLLLSALISADALTPATPTSECCLLPWTDLERGHTQMPTSTKCTFAFQLHRRQSCETANSRTSESSNTEYYKVVPKHHVRVSWLS